MGVLIDDIVTTIDSALDRIAEKWKLTILARHVDNHGALQWQAGHTEDIARFVTVGLVLDEYDRPISLEVWVGADDGRRFVRQEWLWWSSTESWAAFRLDREQMRTLGPPGRDADAPFMILLGELAEELTLAWHHALTNFNAEMLHAAYGLSEDRLTPPRSR